MVPGFGDLVRHRARADHDQVIHESMFALEQSQRGGQLRLCSASGVGESFEKEIALGPAGDAGGNCGLRIGDSNGNGANVATGHLMRQCRHEFDRRVFDLDVVLSRFLFEFARDHQIEKDNELAAFRLLELLDNQFISSGGGSPVDPALAVPRPVAAQSKKLPLVREGANASVFGTDLPYIEQLFPRGLQPTDGRLNNKALQFFLISHAPHQS